MAGGAMKALSLQQLHKRYPNGVEALKGIDLDVEEGEFFALLGPNGAGKTTAIGIVTSLVNKTSGRVEVFGHDMDRELAAAKACIGVVPQEVNFNQFEAVEDIVLNQAGYYGIGRRRARPRAKEYLQRLDLWDRRREPSRNLSGGMKRRLMIARALVHEPRLLILDEPTAGVDIEIRRSMWRFLTDINRRGTTIILTTHYLEEAENLCRKVAIIDHGRIIENSSTSALLDKLHVETFVLNLRHPVERLPDMGDYEIRVIDDSTFEVEIRREQSFNELFRRLSGAGIEVRSMRNKVNRLEELFVRMVEQGKVEKQVQGETAP
jgi:ABC-2 type transport system ATP-binding protein